MVKSEIELLDDHEKFILALLLVKRFVQVFYDLKYKKSEVDVCEEDS